MPTDVKILSARRGYEYRMDDLRLTFLTTPGVTNRLKERFSFQTAQLGTPIDTFGTVPNTAPPGLVFNYGTMTTPDGTTVPIRFIHIEVRRIVIEITGPSALIDGVFGQLLTVVNEIRSPDGTVPIGPPVRILEHSELSAVLGFTSDALLTPPLAEWLRGQQQPPGSGAPLTPTVAMQIALWQPNASYEGGGQNAITLAVRAGTAPSDRHFFSSAPLATDAHQGWLTQVESLVQAWEQALRSQTR